MTRKRRDGGGKRRSTSSHQQFWKRPWRWFRRRDQEPMTQWQVQVLQGCTQDHTAASNRLAVLSQCTSEDEPLRVEAISSHPQKCLVTKEQLLPRWFSGKESACQAGDMGSAPGSGRFPGEGNSNPPQYSCLGNPIEEPRELQSMGSQRVGHDLATKPQQYSSWHNVFKADSCSPMSQNFLPFKD